MAHETQAVNEIEINHLRPRKRMKGRKMYFPCLASFLAVAVAYGAEPSPLAHLCFQPSMQAGYRDQTGKLVAGTEVMHLVAHQGRLYASTSLWMEKDPSVPKACQVLVLDSPKGRWRVEKQFTINNLRYGSLKEITFATDATGKAVPPVPLLLAAPDVKRGRLKIYCQEGTSGEWSESTLGTVTGYATTRAIGLYRDRVTGIDRVFAGTDKLGTISGVYDPEAPGRIQWEKSAEFQTPEGERVMGYCQCNETFYCATSRRIYERVDGLRPSWKEVYFCPKETKPCGIRGLSAVPKPGGTGEVLWFAALSKARRLDPAEGFKETVELDLPVFLTARLGVKVTFALSAYNELMPYAVPGDKLWLFGLECCYPVGVVNTHPRIKAHMQVKENPRAFFAGEARFCIRHAQGANITYELAEITDPQRPMLVSTRVIAISPFPGDQGKALYFGGYDCNSVPSHNTAWIYRG